MIATRRILSPVVASIAAGLVVAVAAVGGTLSGAAAKGDRFAGVGDSLCAVEMGPECRAWSEADGVRFVTLETSDGEEGVTTLIRIEGAAAAY